MAELTEVRDRAALDADDRGRVRGSGARDRGRARARPRARGRTSACARGLKELVGFGAARYAVIDVGTNSVKFHVGERRADGDVATIVDRAEITRLGEGLDGDRPAGAGADGAHRRRDRGDGRRGAARGRRGDRRGRHGRPAHRARTAPSFVDAVRERCGVEIEVISGEEEARLAYLAAMSGLGARRGGSLVVFDTGGGSSQFTFGHGDERRRALQRRRRRRRASPSASGSTRPSPTRRCAAALERDRARSSTRLDGRPTPDALVGMGGAVTNLAAVKHELATYDPDVVQGTVLDRAEIDRQIELYRTRTPKSGARSPGCSPSARRSSSPAPASCGPCSRSSAASRSRSATAACATACSSSGSGRRDADLPGSPRSRREARFRALAGRLAAAALAEGISPLPQCGSRVGPNRPDREGPGSLELVHALPGRQPSSFVKSARWPAPERCARAQGRPDARRRPPRTASAKQALVARPRRARAEPLLARVAPADRLRGRPGARAEERRGRLVEIQADVPPGTGVLRGA